MPRHPFCPRGRAPSHSRSRARTTPAWTPNRGGAAGSNRGRAPVSELERVRRLLVPEIFRVSLRRLAGVVRGMLVVTVRDVGMMGCFVRVARLVMLRRFTVVVRRALVMVRGLRVVIDVLHINLQPDSFRVALKPACTTDEGSMKLRRAAASAGPD